MEHVSLHSYMQAIEIDSVSISDGDDSKSNDLDEGIDNEVSSITLTMDMSVIYTGDH